MNPDPKSELLRRRPTAFAVEHAGIWFVRWSPASIAYDGKGHNEREAWADALGRLPAKRRKRGEISQAG